MMISVRSLKKKQMFVHGQRLSGSWGLTVGFIKWKTSEKLSMWQQIGFSFMLTFVNPELIYIMMYINW